MLVLLVATLCKSGKAERLYQSEGLPHNLSIEEFLDQPSGKAERCLKQGVPVNEFNKWFKDTHKRIRPIQVDGIPSVEAKVSSGDVPVAKDGNPVRIAVTICMSNGVLVKRKDFRDSSKGIPYDGRFREESLY